MSTLQPNELSEFASFNYIWTLAVLTEEEVNTATYLNRDPQYILARTGGYTKPNTLTTFEEDEIGVNVEYFIDEVEINSFYAPNPRTGITNGVKIDFKILEPYSVGLFFQTLALAANQLNRTGAGYSSLPLLLRCEFIGYTSDGSIVQKIVRDIAISLVNMTFTVDAGGAIYSVESIPWNQLAFGDIAQQTRSDVQINGYSVEQILSSGPNSLVNYLNQYEENLRISNNKPFADEYVIEFPDSMGNYVESTFVPVAGYDRGDVDPGRLAEAARIEVTTSPVSSVARPGLNAIGASSISDDFNANGNQPHGLDVVVWNETRQIWVSGSLTITTDRIFSFRQGSTISEMIEKVVLTSTWARSIIERLESTSFGTVEWFRIETNVFTLENGQKMRYVYKVVPYQVDRSIFESRSENRDYTQLLPNVKKGYNYIYTGLNTDIINFDIKINFAFFQNLIPDGGAGATITSLDSAASTSQTDVPLYSTANAFAGYINTLSANMVDPGGNIVPSITSPSTGTATVSALTTSGITPGGSGTDSAKFRIASEFHNVLLNSDVELISIDLEVWGDPYFMPDSGLGNHTTNRGMNYQDGEIDIAFNFNTPIDYKNGLLQLSAIGYFIGLYKIVKITHTFSKGEFKQVLNMIRRPNQNKNTLEAVRAMLVEYETGVEVPGMMEVFINGTPSEKVAFIYNQIIDTAATAAVTAGSIIPRVLSFQNISNILPLPSELLNLFGTIRSFGTTFAGIATSVSQTFETYDLVPDSVSNTAAGIQSAFTSTVSSISSLF